MPIICLHAVSYPLCALKYVGLNVAPSSEHLSLPSCASAVDLSDSHKVHESEFRDLIMHMAAADLHSRQAQAKDGDEEWVRCSLESDDEIQEKLKSWIDHIMVRKNAPHLKSRR